MAENETLLTREGYNKLQAELEYLKTAKRPEIADKLRIARGFGDLSENGEYDAAKEEQATVEARIFEIEGLLKEAKVVDVDEVHGASQPTAMAFGLACRLLDVEYNEELTFQLVGTTEADPKSGKISTESPLGQKLIGARVGDTVYAETPVGQVEYRLLEILRPQDASGK